MLLFFKDKVSEEQILNFFIDSIKPHFIIKFRLLFEILGLKPGTVVSIYAASTNCCKKGCTQVKSVKNKTFVGNGIVRMSRYDIFVNPTKNP